MEKALEELSASALRNLLIEEIRKFIVALDNDPTDELDRKKIQLRKIFNLIREKEQKENLPLIWGKSSTTPHINSSFDLKDGSISNQAND
jgi:hypothetical protein